ncbi:ferrous iron transporter B [bacterium]|nr:ferrous iron transporter B [Candidatus Omnitrophota bacterium]MBU3930122.1 ferrous iron transporter B [bacterium]MBU4122864.1 ferrous iron transporter B [bacterium]
MKKILLMGNPNVGKSAVFSRLTGVDVITSNYSGTTVGYTRGCMHMAGEKVELIDVPGVYSLAAGTKAEEVALGMLKEGEIVLNIVDATRLERNLKLTLQLISRRVPMLVVLNMWDETKHRGIEIDVPKLEEILGIPVVAVCAVSGEGISELVGRMAQARVSGFEYDVKDVWAESGRIAGKAQKFFHRHHTFLETLADASISPLTGIPIALIIAALSFTVIRFIGEGLITHIFEPVFEKLWGPFIVRTLAFLSPGGIAHEILIGKLIDGNIDFVQSMGLLTTGLFVPVAMVLPYVFSFYLVLGFLEDSGYLPRIGVLSDNLMHRVGLHGLAIIPMMLGLGCNVPAAMATRVLETRRERFIAATLMAIAVPCMAQIAMIMGLVGNYGAMALAQVFGTLFIVWIILGLLQNALVKGESPEIFVEIPPYRMPYMKVLFEKVWMRVKWFIKEAVPFVMLGVLVVNLLYALGVIEFLGKLAAPVITGIMGLPEETVAALVVSFLRKDVAVGMLAPLGLSVKQLVIASVVLTMYFPCVATFAVLIKELGVKDMMKSALIMIAATLFVGGILNLIL